MRKAKSKKEKEKKRKKKMQDENEKRKNWKTSSKQIENIKMKKTKRQK
jgi:hypothetical protein